MFSARLEDRLLKSQIVNSKQITMIRELQSSSDIELVEALVALDILTQDEVDRITRSMQSAHSVKLEEIPIDLEAVSHVPRHVAITYRCIPIRKTGNTLVVAVCDSNLDNVQSALQGVTDFEIVMVIAERDALDHAVYIYYGEGADEQLKPSERKLRFVTGATAWSLQPAWRNTFDNFLAHDGVSRAKEVGKQVASSTSELFNLPIIFVGQKGSGKTHLINAVKNYCSTTEPLLRGLQLSGHQLVSALADYRLSGQLNALRFELRDCELLLIDDFAGAWGSEWAETEIAETIETMRSKKAPILLTLTEEEFVTGPHSLRLRDVLGRGTEVRMRAPDKSAITSILEMHCGSGENLDCALLNCPQLNADYSWSNLQEVALATIGTGISRA